MWRVNVNNVQNVSLSIAPIASFAFSQKGIEAKEVYGEYCFTKDIEDSKEVWNLEQYKRNSQFLFTYIPCSYKGNYSLTLNNSGVLFGVPLYSSRYKENDPSKCDKEEALERDTVIANKFIIEALKMMQKKLQICPTNSIILNGRSITIPAMSAKILLGQLKYSSPAFAPKTS